ncbi:MAG TPA: hypothetical protein VGR35_23695 [Tepidisphaeraceae bacterium]|nr:hypothetical protein [Tepidisphaeraceae bacterium]
MPKYNLTHEQQGALKRVTDFYAKQGNQPLVHFQADQAHVLMGQQNNHLQISIDDLHLFEREDLVSLRDSGHGTTIVTLRQSAHDAIAQNFEKPSPPPAIGQVGQAIFGNVSGSTFQTAIGDYNTLQIANANAAELLKAVAAVVADLRPLVQESLPPDEAEAVEADLAEIERQIESTTPDKGVLTRRLKSLGSKVLGAIDYGVNTADAVAQRGERLGSAIVKIGGLAALLAKLTGQGS